MAHPLKWHDADAEDNPTLLKAPEMKEPTN
jgi:hypothetical protein